MTNKGPKIVAISVAICSLCIGSPSFSAINPKAPSASLRPDIADLLAKAETAVKQGHPEVALIHLKNAESAAPNNGEIHLRLGEVFLLRNAPSEAERELNVALEKGVPRSAALPQIFQALLAQRKGQLLLDKYAAPSAADHSKLAIDILLARAGAQIQIGKRQDAIASVDQALLIDRVPHTLIPRAQLAQAIGDDALANRLADEALSKQPSDTSALVLKINLLQRAKQPARALDYANRLLKVTNNQPFSFLTRAGVLLQLGEDLKAESDLDRVLSVAPNNMPAIFYKAMIKARAKDIKGAWEAVQALPRGFVTSKPEMGAAVGEMAAAAGHRDTAIDILHTTIQLFPKDVGARVALSTIYLSANEVPEAMSTIAPVKESSDPRVNALLARVYARENKIDESLQSLKKAGEEGYGGEALQRSLATANIARGKLDEGIAILQKLNAKSPNQPEVVGALVTALLRKGDVEKAAVLAEDLVTSQPKNPLGPFYLGLVYARKGELEKAVNAYGQALSRDPKLSAASYNRGLLLAAKGDLAGAQRDLRQAILTNPQNVSAAIRLSSMLQSIGEQEPALKILTGSAAANPKNAAIYSELYRFYAARHRWREAESAIESYRRHAPSDGTGLALEAEMQLEMGSTDAAIGILRPLVQRYPHSQDLAILLARAYAKKGDNNAAQKILRTAIADENRSPATYIALIQNELATQNMQQALKDADAFVAAVPGATSSQIRATVLIAQKKHDQAEALLQRSIASYPDPGTVIQLSVAYRTEGKQKRADELLLSWLNTHPKDIKVRATYAESLMSRDRSAAEAQFRQILSYDPFDVVSMNNLAWLLSGQDLRQAETLADRAIRIAPSSASVQDTAAWIKWQLHKAPEALALLQQAHNNDAHDPEIAYHFAVVLAATGRKQEASQVLADVLKRGLQFDDLPKVKELAIALRR